MDNVTRLVPDGISHIDQHQAAMSGMNLDQRMMYHAKQIRSIGFTDGVNGVAAYKKAYPEAAPIRLDLRSLAFVPKPKGYAAKVVSMVEMWLVSDRAAHETNRADVDRINAHFQTSRFNPDNFFSRPIPMRLRQRLAELFERRGMTLDVAKVDTLSKFRAAAKAMKGYEQASQSFGSVGVVSGRTLVLGTRTFAIEAHNGHDCLRFSIAGKRVRLRLDALEPAVEGLADSPRAAGDDLPTTMNNSIGELAPDSAAPVQAGNLASCSGEVAPNPWATTFLDERLAALRSTERPHSTIQPGEVDPLTL